MMTEERKKLKLHLIKIMSNLLNTCGNKELDNKLAKLNEVSEVLLKIDSILKNKELSQVLKALSLT
jgi:hypothetical protein